MKSLPQNKGFSLIELMVVVILLAIIATIALPNFGEFIRSQRAKNVSFELVADLSHARSEAIKRNTNVTVAPQGEWKSGWTMVAAGETVRTRDAIGDGVTITGPTSIVFSSSGRVNASVKISLTGGGGKRCVRFELSGVPRSEKGDC